MKMFGISSAGINTVGIIKGPDKSYNRDKRKENQDKLPHIPPQKIKFRSMTAAFYFCAVE
jgi:hypothetical protein